MEQSSQVLILTPVKDAVQYLDTYVERLGTLSYPHHRLSIAFLESDSRDESYLKLRSLTPQLESAYRRVGLWKRDFGYRMPDSLPRWTPEFQVMRRSILARSRNHLLFRALSDEDWVLWLDVDVVEYPADIIERLITTGRSIVTPNCVTEFGGTSFDLNAWRSPDDLHLSDLRQEGDLVRLDSVGGTMLLVRADVHRDGLIFPPFPYGRPHAKARPHLPELETEGLGLMASDMGHQCWGMPNLEIRHSRD